MVQDRIAALVDGYIDGRMTRDELVRQLVAIAGGEARSPARDGVFTSLGINHVALSVSDVSEMADFMGRHLGTTVIRSSDEAGFLACGANNFVGLFKRETPGLNHVCFSVEGYDPDDAAARIEGVGLRAHRAEDRVFFPGPDGILFQVADTWGDYPAP